MQTILEYEMENMALALLFRIAFYNLMFSAQTWEKVGRGRKEMVLMVFKTKCILCIHLLKCKYS